MYRLKWIINPLRRKNRPLITERQYPSSRPGSIHSHMMDRLLLSPTAKVGAAPKSRILLIGSVAPAKQAILAGRSQNAEGTYPV
jgi:hypothetical protein